MAKTSNPIEPAPAVATTSAPPVVSAGKRALLSPAITPVGGDGRIRVVIDAVLPMVDGGRFAVKRVVGEPVAVTVHAFTDGHDAVRVRLCWCADGVGAGTESSAEMEALGNDVWQASFTPDRTGRYRYWAVAWVDHFKSWRLELARRVDPGDIRLAAIAGAALVEQAAERASGSDRDALLDWAERLRQQADSDRGDVSPVKDCALDPQLAEWVSRYPDRSLETRSTPDLPLTIDRERAVFSSWYEMFPRSAALEEGRHGTFKDVEALLPSIAEMGFDVLYLPPIHPIGRTRRKGRNNALTAEAGDVGSPWAIGAEEGGHTAILPALGTPEDFRQLVAAAGALGIELALDIAFQCAPDHPWVEQHPQWFRWRADGSVQYAENPPKKYQDIYPFNFETEDWQGLWQALKSVFEHWIGEGVRIFRVDNPHTKAFPFWEWCVGELKRDHPDVLFLAEAFTRPKVMHRLAKLGYSQSYTYFTWRNTREELIEYFTELTEGPGRDYFRPNVWPNTPDILNEHLHHAPRAVFMTRLLLAATLCGNYGMYGPAYELMESTPRDVGGEEYLDSEKYQIRHWDRERADSLRGFIAQVNRIRKENPALQGLSNEAAPMRFLDTDNPQLIAYARRSADGANLILVVVNLDPQFRQSGWVQVDAVWLGLEEHDRFVVDDLLGGQSFTWRHGANFVILDPGAMPAHLLRVQWMKAVELFAPEPQSGPGPAA